MTKDSVQIKALPEVIFITDCKRVPNADEVIASLPANSAVIIRDYDHPRRQDLAAALVHAAKNCGVMSLIAGDSALARKVGADGIHMPEYQLWQTRSADSGFALVTAAVKSRKSMVRAATIGVDMALVSPVFQTGSHPDRSALGIHRFSRIINNAPLPIIALGGINESTMKRLIGLPIAGIAAIDGLA